MIFKYVNSINACLFSFLVQSKRALHPLTKKIMPKQTCVDHRCDNN